MYEPAGYHRPVQREHKALLIALGLTALGLVLLAIILTGLMVLFLPRG